MAHRQAVAVAVAPSRTGDRAQQGSRPDLAEVPQRLSSSTRCLTATCAAGSRCCILQPPQAPRADRNALARRHAQQRLAVDLGQLGLLPLVLPARGGGADDLGRQRAIDEDDLPSGLRATPWASRSIEVISSQPSGSAGLSAGSAACRFSCSIRDRFQREGRYLSGSTGLPWRRTSKCNLTRSASLLPISAIFWPARTFWSSLTSRIWLCVGGQVGVVVLEDDQVAVATQTRAGVDHAPSAAASTGSPALPAMSMPCCATRRTRSSTLPPPGQPKVSSSVVTALPGVWAAGLAAASPFLALKGRGFTRASAAAATTGAATAPCPAGRVLARRRDAQHLADLDQVGILERVPARQIAGSDRSQADARERVASLDRVIAGLAGIFLPRQVARPMPAGPRRRRAVADRRRPGSSRLVVVQAASRGQAGHQRDLHRPAGQHGVVAPKAPQCGTIRSIVNLC